MNMSDKINQDKRRFPEMCVGFYEIPLSRLRKEEKKLDEILLQYEKLLSEGKEDYITLAQKRFKAIFDYLKDKYHFYGSIS